MKTLILSFFIINAHAAELAKPNLRSLLTVLLSEKSKSEADGITRFVDAKKINLDQLVPVTVKHKTVWLSGREIKFSSDNKTFTYNGVNYKTDSSKSFDVAVEDAYQRMRPGQSHFSFFIPQAIAAPLGEAAIQTVILGWATSAPTAPSFWLNVKNTTTHAVGVALGSTLVPCAPREQGELKILSATCDKNGLRVETSDHKIAEGKLMNDGTVKFKSSCMDEAHSKGSMSLEIEKSGAQLVAQCTSNPFDPEAFKVALQNSMNKRFHGNAMVENNPPSSSSTP